MRRFLPAVGFLAAVPLLVATLKAADAPKSGPQPGEYLPGPFHPLNVTKAWAGKFHCLVCEHGANPVVAVFAREPGTADQPLAQLLKQLDDAVGRHQKAQLGSFAVFLNEAVAKEEPRAELVKRLQDLASGLGLKHVTLALDGAAGPKGYQIPKEADVTVLLYVKHKVVANHAFEKDGLTEKDVQAIGAEVEKLLSAKKK
jgi:hypothetical protein